MKSKEFTIFKLYEFFVAAIDEHGYLYSIRPSLLTQFFELDKTYKVWCSDLGDHEFEIHAIRGEAGFGIAKTKSDGLKFDQKVFDKLRKFGAYYNHTANQWIIDMRIMRNEEYEKEIKEILPEFSCCVLQFGCLCSHCECI